MLARTELVGGTMSDAKYLDIFPAWLRSLGDDAEALGEIIGEKSVPEAPRQIVAGGLNYLFKSLDLIPDGIDDIGYLDDAFVLRIAAELAIQEDCGELPAEKLKTLNRLATDADTVREFLMQDFTRLVDYVKGLRKGAARGRSVADIVNDPATQTAFLSDVRGFGKGYQPPSFSREEKNLVKLKAFFDAKLPK
jgi:uncharacterized membrane protein YkvA (DUF1232 family)